MATADQEELPSCAECERSGARVFCGGEHTLLRNPETLEVYQLGACGLGFDHDKSASAEPASYIKRVPLPGPANLVAAGYYSNFFKLVGGQCFAYGCGRQSPNDGQLFNGSFAEDTTPSSTRVSFAEAVAGGHHSVCRTRRGEVWVCGAGWQGQMGNGTLEYKNPDSLRVQGIPRALRLFTGYYHIGALGDDAEWYVWGCNEQGQLGPYLDAGDQVLRPRRLSDGLAKSKLLQGAQVQALEGGYGHTIALLSDGRVLTMGNQSEGQRALPPDDDEVPPVSLVEGLPGPAEAIAAGNHHCLVIVQGRVFAFGSDEFGQVSGQGASTAEDADHRAWKPREVAGLPERDPVVRISAGGNHSAAQTFTGRIFLWGCGANGQTGDLSLPESSPAREVDVHDIARKASLPVSA